MYEKNFKTNSFHFVFCILFPIHIFHTFLFFFPFSFMLFFLEHICCFFIFCFVFLINKNKFLIFRMYFKSISNVFTLTNSLYIFFCFLFKSFLLINCSFNRKKLIWNYLLISFLKKKRIAEVLSQVKFLFFSKDARET